MSVSFKIVFWWRLSNLLFVKKMQVSHLFHDAKNLTNMTLSAISINFQDKFSLLLPCFLLLVL